MTKEYEKLVRQLRTYDNDAKTYLESLPADIRDYVQGNGYSEEQRNIVNYLLSLLLSEDEKNYLNYLVYEVADKDFESKLSLVMDKLG